jgi:hypothetical protein
VDPEKEGKSAVFFLQEKGSILSGRENGQKVTRANGKEQIHGA